MKYQIMILCVACTLLTAVGVAATTLPNVIKALKISTEAHMNDFVAAHSEKINDSINDISERIDLLEDASNKTYDYFNKTLAEKPEGKNVEANIAVLDEMADNSKKLMFKILESDQNENAEVFITNATGKIVNSTNQDAMDTMLSEEEYQSYITEDNRMLTSSYYDDEKKEAIIAYSKTLFTDGKVSGVLVYKTNSTYLNELMDEYTLTEIPAPRIYVLNSDGLVIAHTNKESVGSITKNEVLVPALEKLNQGEVDSKTHTGYYLHQGSNVSVSYVYIPGVDWILGLNVLDSEIYQQVNTIKSIYLISSIIILTIVVVFIVFLAMAFTKPMEYINGIIGKIENLDFTFDVNDKQFSKIRSKSDEIGDMGRSVENMIVAVKNNLDEIKLCTNEVNSAALQLMTVTTDINEKVTDNSAITEELSAGMEETTASTDIITANVQSVQENVETIKEQVEKSTDITLEIMERAKKLQKQASDAEKKTRTIFDGIKQRGENAIEQSKATAQINELAQVIMEIANQTSLLSLNASIEAARAGESGKGFAVVADEIGNLAQQSSDTVNKIKSIVENVNEAVSNIRDCLSESQNFVEENVYKDYANQLVMLENYNNDANRINQTMNEVDQNTNVLYGTMKDISVSIKEINATIQEASVGITDIATRNGDISESTSKCDEMANIMDSVSNQLEQSVKAFKL